MSGYANDAIDALVLGKALNIILLDRRDMESVIIRGAGFKNVLKLKLRKAAEEGAIHFPADVELVTAEKSEPVEIDYLRDNQTTGRARMQPAGLADLLIICEGESDRVAISVLAEGILRAARSTRSIKIIVANGKVIIPRVANAFWDTLQPTSHVLIVADGDNESERTRAMLADGLELDNWVAAIPNPSIETWRNLDRQGLRRFDVKSRLGRFKSAAARVDLEALRSHDAQFAKFYEAILGK